MLVLSLMPVGGVGGLANYLISQFANPLIFCDIREPCGLLRKRFIRREKDDKIGQRMQNKANLLEASININSVILSNYDKYMQLDTW
jgi:hypothetical protein